MDGRQVNHSGEITVQTQPGVDQPLLLPFPAGASQPGQRNCGACTPVGTAQGEAGRSLHSGLSGGKSCSWITMLAQFYQGTYMHQDSTSSFVFRKFFQVTHCYSSSYPKNLQGLPAQEGLGTK